jgi:hypothetical protein
MSDIERRLQKIGLTPGSKDYELAKKTLENPDRKTKEEEKYAPFIEEAMRGSKTPLPSELIQKYNKGGKVGSASKRADGIAKRGKTRGKLV